MIVAGSAELASGRFRRDRRIRDRDTDMLGHVNNVVWVRFVVELGYAHSEAVGWGQHGYRELGAWWVVYRQQVEYHAAAFPGETIVEETWVREMRGARSVRESRFRRADDGALLVTASTVWVLADIENQRPRRVPPELLSAFRLLDESAHPHKPSRR